MHVLGHLLFLQVLLFGRTFPSWKPLDTQSHVSEPFYLYDKIFKCVDQTTNFYFLHPFFVIGLNLVFFWPTTICVIAQISLAHQRRLIISPCTSFLSFSRYLDLIMWLNSQFCQQILQHDIFVQSLPTVIFIMFQHTCMFCIVALYISFIWVIMDRHPLLVLIELLS